MTAGVLRTPGVLPAQWTLSAEAVRQTTLWLMVFGGSFVMFEPSPYELGAVMAFVTWLSAMRLSRELLPILFLILLYMIGSLITLVPVMHLPNTVSWTIIGWFLAFTGLFYAMILSERTVERLDVIVRAYVLTAAICGFLGIVGYFGLIPGSEALLRYGRAKSTFADPNVFGPFLVLPALILIQRIFIDGMKGIVRNGVMLMTIVIGLLLSFSRGAWGHMIVSVALMIGMTLWSARSRALKMRIVAMCIAGVVLMGVMIVVLLSMDSVQQVFLQRASLDQDYDGGKFGRFGRHIMGFQLALDKPIGIGMLQFAPLFGEDAHNTYLNAFMAYGWLGGMIWPSIVILTLYAGYRYCFKPSPWRHIFICVMATYQFVILEAWIIDIDHWRHVWLLFGLIWGLAIATARLERGDPQAVADAMPAHTPWGRRWL